MPEISYMDLPKAKSRDLPTTPMTPFDEHQDTSDEDYQHALEVVFDHDNPRRRKSSLVPSETSAFAQQRHRSTSCFVHSLLEKQGLAAGDNRALESIAETLATHRIDSGALKGVQEAHDRGDIANDDEGGKCIDAKPREIPAVDGAALGNGGPSPPDGQEAAAASDVTHSRLLTKKQLSDMAWGVRQLSKRLGSIKLKLNVRNVFLLTKAHDETLIEKTRELTRWLLSEERSVRYTVYVEDILKNNKKFNAKGILADLEEARRKEASQHATSGSVKNDVKSERRLRYWNNDMCRTRPHAFDFVVTLGGDGTILYASWLFQKVVPPVLSFALGSLGFLTKFEFEDYQNTLTKAFQDGVTVSLRLRFEGTVMRSQKKRKPRRLVEDEDIGPMDKREGDGEDGDDEDDDEDREASRDLVEELVGEEQGDERTHKPDGSHEILNDIVVDRGPNPTMSAIEIFGDDEHFTTVQADGVCVATPTGSTAYNLAAGGSLCHPENPVILVSAICAHTLSFRPIILPDTIVLRIGVPYDARASSWASFDGRERVELNPGDYVTISASRYPFANVMQPGRRSEDWVNSISGKLGWNSRQRQKAYKEWKDE